jgi:hypothetical protein
MPRPYRCLYSTIEPEEIEVGLLVIGDEFWLDGRLFRVVENSKNNFVLVTEVHHENTVYVDRSVLVLKH